VTVAATARDSQRGQLNRVGLRRDMLISLLCSLSPARATSQSPSIQRRN